MDERQLDDSAITAKLETDDHLMAMREISQGLSEYVARKEGRTVEEAKKYFDDLLGNAIREAGMGVTLAMTWYTCVGRKRTSVSPDLGQGA